MPNKEWGVKRVCPETGRRFYDLNKDPVISPYTGKVVELDADDKTRQTFADKEDDKAESVLEDDGAEVLEDEDEDTVSLDDIADVADESDDD